MKARHEATFLGTFLLCPTPVLSQQYRLFRYAVRQIRDPIRLKINQAKKNRVVLSTTPSAREKTRAERCMGPFLWATARAEFFLSALRAYTSSYTFLSSSLCLHKLHSDLVQGMHLATSYTSSLCAVLVFLQPGLPLGYTSSCVGLTEEAVQGYEQVPKGR